MVITVQTDAKEVRSHFSTLAEQGVWASLYKPNDSITAESWSFLIRARRIIELLQSLAPRATSVLDIGCGTAPIARSIVGMGKRYTGLDFSPEMIEAAERDLGDLRSKGEVSLKVADVTRLDLPDGQFDVVIAMGLIEYLTPEQIRQVLTETTRVLRGGGLTLLTIPKRWHWGTVTYQCARPLAPISRSFRKLVGAKDLDDIRRRFLTARELDEACNEAGLTKIEERHYNFQIICRPATILAPRLSYFVNRPLEGLSLLPVGKHFATGYIGAYIASKADHI